MTSLAAAPYLLTSPGRSFAVIRDSAPWLALLTVLSASSLLHYRLPQPVLVSLPPDAGPDLVLQSGELFRVLSLARLFLAPVLIATRWLAGASLMWLLLLAGGGSARFSRVFSLVAHVSVISHLYDWVGLLILGLRGTHAIETADDVRPALGLDRLLPIDSDAVVSICASLNPFSLWQLAVLVAGGYWAIVVGTQAALASMAGTMAG